MRILGIDPGSRFTGYAVIDAQGSRLQCVQADRWVLSGADMGGRLFQLHERLHQLIRETQPDTASVETVFVKLNPSSAIKLGQARGVILCALAQHQIPLNEYSPAKIKQSICGSGRADKSQVGWMIQRLLNLPEPLPEDAADAAGAAICHHQHLPAKHYRIAKT